MSKELLDIGLRENRAAFEPGEIVEGAVRWELEEAPLSAELHLKWYTRGKGTQDFEIVERVELEAPAAGDVRTFSFRAPESPYSFSGKLISLLWCVELVIMPGSRTHRSVIVIAPERREVLLPTSAQ